MKKFLVLTLVSICLVLSACGGNDTITKDDAKRIALEQAGFKSEDVRFTRIERDREDGAPVYEVEFYTKDFKEYDYEIDAKSGKVISFDEDAETVDRTQESNADTAIPEGEVITPERAKEIASSKVAGSSVGDIRELEFDTENGKKVYEGKLIYDTTEYEFEIDAKTGEIIKWEKESVFD